MQKGLRLSSAALLVCLFAGCASSSPTNASIDAARKDAEELFRASRSPGFAVAVVQDGRTVWSEGFGVADLASGRGVTKDSRFRIGSLTKLLTATTLARLADRSVVGLDDPVHRYVPAFADERVTLGQLAHHLSGIRHYGRAEYVNQQHYDGVAQSLGKFIGDPLLALPGEKYLYSSYGYNLLGAALESAAHTAYPELVRREVLEPFAMRDTSFDPGQATGTVKFYELDKAGTVTDGTPIDLSDRLPSGGALSTPSDLARFAIGVMSLPPRLQASLFTSGETSDGKATNVGLAWRLATDDSGRRYVHHGGDTVGGRAFLLVYPDQKVAVVLLANLSFAPFGEKEAKRVAAHFLPRESPSAKR